MELMPPGSLAEAARVRLNSILSGFGSNGIYPSRAGLVGASVASSVTVVLTLGYATATDDGGAIYAAQSTAPTYPGSYFQTADSRYWVLQPDAGGINAKAFGAKSDGAVSALGVMTGTDNIVPLQQAMDYATYGAKCPLYLPAGNFLMSGPLQMGWGTGAVAPVLRGTMVKNRGGSSAGTAILCNFSNAMGLALNGVRYAQVENLALFGKNYNYILANALGTTTTGAADLLESAWVDPTLDANANSQNAPYAAIAVDPYAGTQPATHYPDRTPPAWLAGWTGQYGAAPSSNYIFRNVQIAGFVVAFVNQPSNVNSNGDFPTLINVEIEKCVYGISIGGTQCRNLNCLSVNMARVHTGLTSCAHGSQTGKLQGVFTGQISQCIQWVNSDNAANAGPLSFRDCYGETVFKLGRWLSGGASAKPLVFDNCVANFTGQTEGVANARGRPRFILDTTNPNPVTFRAGTYVNFRGLFSVGGVAADYGFTDDVTIIPLTSPATPVERVFRQFLGGVGFAPSLTSPNPERFNVAISRYSQSALLGTETLGDATPLQRSHTACAWSRRARPVNDPSYILPVPRLWTTKTKSSLSSCSISGLEVTLVFSSLSDDVAAQQGWKPGCALYDDNSKVWLRIHSRSTTTVIATIVTGYIYDGTTTTLETPFSTSVGNFYAGNALAFLPADVIFGNIDSTSSTIASVGRADGVGSAIASEIVAGDFFYADTRISNWITSANTLIGTVTNGSPGSIVLSGTNKPAKTATAFPLGYVIQAAPANE